MGGAGMDGNGRGVLAGLGVAAVAAVVFLALWVMRGGDMDRLSGELRASREEAARAAKRLEDDLRAARQDADGASRKAAELEGRLREETRRAATAASQLERRLRDEAAEAERRLEDAIAEQERLRGEISAKAEREIAAARAELHKARDELESARQAGRAELSRLNGELEASRKTIGDLEKRLEAGRKESEALEGAIRDTRLNTLKETGGIDEAAITELNALKTELASTGRALAEAKNANAVLERARDTLAETMRKEREEAAAREAGLRRSLNELTPLAGMAGTVKETDGNRDAKGVAEGQGSGTVSPERDLAEAARKAEAAEKRHAEQIARAAAEYRAMDETWQSEVAARKKEFDAWIRRSRAVSQAADAAWRDRLARAESEAAAKTKAAADDFSARLSAVEKEAEKRIAALEKSHAAKLGEQRDAFEKKRELAEKEAAGKTARLEEQRDRLAGELAAMRRVAGMDKESFALARPGRSVGRIVERMADGQTLLISGGVNQRVRPGMKFDAYRPVGDRNRYVGTIKVIRPLDDFSMAISCYDDAEVMVCPVTGRAVLEPGARFSPYVADADGKPVELQKAIVAGLSLEAPAIGDYIDNPFYDPERPVTFLAEGDLAGNDRVAKAIQDMGGLIRSDVSENPDYILIRGDDAAAGGTVDGPRRVTFDHLAGYLAPRPTLD